MLKYEVRTCLRVRLEYIGLEVQYILAALNALAVLGCIVITILSFCYLDNEAVTDLLNYADSVVVLPMNYLNEFV